MNAPVLLPGGRIDDKLERVPVGVLGVAEVELAGGFDRAGVGQTALDQGGAR